MAESVGAAGTAGVGQSYPSKDHAGQPHHYGNDCSGAPGAGAEITIEYLQMQHSVGYDDQPQHHGHDGPLSPTVADATGGAGQSQPSEDRAASPTPASIVAQSRPGVMPETLAPEFPFAALSQAITPKAIRLKRRQNGSKK
jgi:hypothetical protein